MSDLATGSIKKLIKERRLMPPLWMAYPNVCQYSMNWRMGSGEGYADRFREWLHSFSEEDRAVLRKMFPTPVGWCGWWLPVEEFVDDPTFYEKGKLFTGYWEPTGQNKYCADWLNQRLREGEALNTVSYPSDAASGVLATGWLRKRFDAPAGDPEMSFYSVMGYVLRCQSLYFDDSTPSDVYFDVTDKPERWRSLMPRVESITDAEWERILPGLLSLGFYYQITQNKELLDVALSSRDTSVYIVDDPDDRIFCGRRSEDGYRLAGQNRLGFALMNAREEVYKIYKNAWACEKFEDI